MTRQKGILLHPTSLNSEFGIGGFGKEAFDFIDYLKLNDYQYWQILPLNYPGFGNSPYNPISCIAASPWLIDPQTLFEMGLVSEQEVKHAKLPNKGSIDFAGVIKSKAKLFEAAFHKHHVSYWIECLNEFLEKQEIWLKPFAVFYHFKKLYNDKSWLFWNDEYKTYKPQFFDSLSHTEPEALFYPIFLQYLIFEQCSALKRYAVEQGIKIIGDVPLYVSLDSSDVWSTREIFELNENGRPIRVAGVPPDAFSDDGQRWGNPLYRWDVMQQDDFAWWKLRLAKAFEFADTLRIDHFIGLINYWAIDASEKTAVNGAWIPGPKHAFFDSMLKLFPPQSFIAEDLGILTDEVSRIRDFYGFPGMIILQFCFEHDQNDILSFPEDKIIYTGTHDNQTTLGWYLFNKKQRPHYNRNLENYLRKVGMLSSDTELTSSNVSTLMTNLAEASPCRIAIVPMQDVLSLDDKARMNKPGKALGNWRWRMV